MKIALNILFRAFLLVGAYAHLRSIMEMGSALSILAATLLAAIAVKD